MNLDDLRAELDAHARDIDTYATGRMSGIRAKIAQRRRRKAGATVAASVLAVGAIVGVPVVSQLNAEPQPAQQGPFPEKIDGDTKIASTMGDEGDTKVTLEFTPEDTDFLLKIECDALAAKGDTVRARLKAPNLRVMVGGAWVWAPCGQNITPNMTPGSGELFVGGVSSADHIRELWADSGVEAGEPTTIKLQVVRDIGGKPVRKPIDGRIGVAVYDMTGERVERGEVALPVNKTYGGESYELGDYDVGTGKSTTASLDVPELDEPALVTYGTNGSTGTGRTITLDGDRGVLRGKSGAFTEPLPDAASHTVRVEDRGGKNPQVDIDVVVAFYTQSDDSNDETEAFPETIDG
ncbi:MAG: hypothetical protein L0K86_27030, partial [Actinomycetia bacterium]|nr:hypothetical protein [Actinomycetes bacterium]